MFKRVVTVVALALAAAPSALAGGPTMTIGATEDIVKQPTLVAAKAQMDKLKLAGLRGIRMTQEWAPGQTEPAGTDFDALKNAVAAAQLDGVQVVLSVTNHGSRTTPLSDQDQSDFATYAANVARALPYVRDFVIGNEPNLNRYWLPQFGLDGSDVTAQPGSTLPLVYDEYGVETQVPAEKARFYSGREAPVTKPVDPVTQGAYYAQAIALTFCQPNVRGLFLFHSVDETDLDRWQSGLYYADGTPKASLAPTRTAVLAARRGIVARCPGLQLPVKAKLDRTSARNPRFSFRLSCDIDCTYRARLEKLPGHSTTMVTRGQVAGSKPLRITFPTRRLGPGRYRFTVRVVAPVNPGPSRSLFSAAFRIL